MTDSLSIKTTGFQTAAVSFKKIQLNGKNLQRGFRVVGKYMKSRILQNFQLQQSPTGKRWQSLRTRTIQRRVSKGLVPIHILTATGRLKKSIHYKLEGKNAVKIGTINYVPDYALAMQIGNKAKRIPARPYVGQSQKDIKNVIRILEATTVDGTIYQKSSGGLNAIQAKLSR